MTQRERRPLIRNYGRGNGEEAMERAAEELEGLRLVESEMLMAELLAYTQALATFALAAFTQELALTADAARNDGRGI